MDSFRKDFLLYIHFSLDTIEIIVIMSLGLLESQIWYPETQWVGPCLAMAHWIILIHPMTGNLSGKIAFLHSPTRTQESKQINLLSPSLVVFTPQLNKALSNLVWPQSCPWCGQELDWRCPELPVILLTQSAPAHKNKLWIWVFSGFFSEKKMKPQMLCRSLTLELF